MVAIQQDTASAEEIVDSFPEKAVGVLPARLDVGDAAAGVAGQRGERFLGVTSCLPPSCELLAERLPRFSHLLRITTSASLGYTAATQLPNNRSPIITASPVMVSAYSRCWPAGRGGRCRPGT